MLKDVLRIAHAVEPDSYRARKATAMSPLLSVNQSAVTVQETAVDEESAVPSVSLLILH